MKLSVAKAAEQWEAAKREEATIKAQLEAAGEVLKEYFRRTGKQDYKGRVGYSKGSRLQLDTAKVKAELADRLPDFQRRITFETLSLLQ